MLIFGQLMIVSLPFALSLSLSSSLCLITLITGEYYCQAFNSINGEVMSAKSPRMILDVYGPPEFTSKV